MNTSLRSRLLTLSAATLVGFGMEVSACQICLPLPTESLADRILSSEQLVLAREDPETPFTLHTVQTLKPADVGPSALDLFLDSTSRRQLALDPELSLLCGWSPEPNGWRRLALHDQSLVPVIAAVIEHAERWEKHPDERVRYFADFLGHEDTVLSDLAHVEVARAPYAQVLRYSDRIPRERLHVELKNFRRMEWHALYILFLSQSEDPRDHAFIRQQLERAAEYRLAIQTAAWATALIEIDGGAGIDRLRELYLQNSGRRPEENEAVHAALRVHGDEGSQELREPIVSAYGELLAHHPALAPALADDLTRWDRRDLVAPVATLLRESPEQFDPTATALLRRYVATVSPKNEAPASVLPTVLTVGLVILALFLGLRGRTSGSSTPGGRFHPAATPMQKGPAARPSRS